MTKAERERERERVRERERDGWWEGNSCIFLRPAKCFQF